MIMTMQTLTGWAFWPLVGFVTLGGFMEHPLLGLLLLVCFCGIGIMA